MKCELCQQTLEAGQVAYYVAQLTGRLLPEPAAFKPDAEEVRELRQLQEDCVWCAHCHTILHNVIGALFDAAHAGSGTKD